MGHSPSPSASRETQSSHSFHIKVTTGEQEHGWLLLHACYAIRDESIPKNSNTLVSVWAKLSFSHPPTSLFKFASLQLCYFWPCRFSCIHMYVWKKGMEQSFKLLLLWWEVPHPELHLQSMKFSQYGLMLLKTPCLEHRDMLQHWCNVIFLICGCNPHSDDWLKCPWVKSPLTLLIGS